MARIFNNSANTVITIANTGGILNFPFSISCWFMINDFIVSGFNEAMFFGLQRTSAAATGQPYNDYAGFSIYGYEGNSVRWILRTISSRFEPSATASVGAYAERYGNVTNFNENKWTHLCGVFTGPEAIEMWIDGVQYPGGSSKSGSLTGIQPDRLTIGSTGLHPSVNFYLERAAIYSTSLAAAEVKVLAAGGDAELVRPDKLAMYLNWRDRYGGSNQPVGGGPDYGTSPPILATKYASSVSGLTIRGRT